MAQGKYRQLFAAELGKLRERAGGLSQVALAKRASDRNPPCTSLSKSTLNDWLGGKAVPEDGLLDPNAKYVGERPNPFSALLYVLFERGEHRKPTRDEVIHWEKLSRNARAEHPGPRPPDRESAPGRPFASLAGPWELSAHEVIQVPGRPELPRMPAYVPRAHDRELARLAALAAAGKSVAVLLFGAPSTGKTRALWETLASTPEIRADWTLWEPAKSGTHAQLMADLERVAPRTVVWLDDTRERLLFSDADAQEELARGLRRLLDDERRTPVLLVDTLWPDDHRDLRTRSAGRHGTHARFLFEGHNIEVPDTFSGAALRAMREYALSDPRIDEALRHARSATPDRSEIAITQYLGGLPRVLQLAAGASAGGKALLQAATEARLLGHGPALPERLLSDGAVAYLEDWEYEQEGEDFAVGALRYLSDGEECRGVRPPLGRVPRRPYEKGAAGPHYRLNDVLEHRARSGGRARQPVPTGMWQALFTHGDPEQFVALGTAAERRGLRRLAERFYARAEAYGDAEAASDRGRLLEDIAPESALRCYRRALEGGSHVSGFLVLRLLERLGRQRSEVAQWRVPQFELDGTAGVVALASAASLARSLELIDKAVELACLAASRGDDVTLVYEGGAWEMVEMLLAADHPEAAEVWARSCALFPDSGLWHDAVKVMVDNGHTAEALAWLDGLGDEQPPCASPLRYRLLRTLGRDDEAWDVLLHRARLGDLGARRELERWGQESGREVPAEEVVTAEAVTAEAEPAVPPAAQEPVRAECLAPSQDDIESVRRSFQEALDSAYEQLKARPDTSRESLLAGDEGQSRLHQALLLDSLFDRACKDGVLDLALRLYEWDPDFRLHRQSGPTWSNWLGPVETKLDVLADTFGAADEIIALLLRAVEAGHGGRDAEHRLIALLHRVGRLDDAERLRCYGIEPGGTIAEPWQPVADGSAEPALST
ncbi:hypothetical protein AB0E85_20155 [Streptomyces sp. NPDC029044]|uniref:hypothetical protein n=1 Tax=Streptomyces sp. NPDC029044 TaxID=3157198 RepID=UPI0033C9EF37